MNISGLRSLNSVIKGNLNLVFLQGNFKRPLASAIPLRLGIYAGGEGLRGLIRVHISVCLRVSARS